jgi:uncharacterized surface anchored protein
VDFALASNPASLTGSVTDAQTGTPLLGALVQVFIAGTPLSGALVQVFIAGTDVPVKSTLTDPNGLYVINGLNEGEYRVVMSADNYGSAIFRIILGPGEARILNAALVANLGTIQGRVTDAQTGTPIAGVGVVIVTQGSGVIVASTRTDSNGNYRVTGIAPGNYNVVFSAANFTSQTVSVNLTAGETEIVNAVLLPNPATIQGQVIDAQTGAGIEGAIVTVTDSAGNIIARVETDSNGRFTVSNLHPGQYTLVASVLGYITGSEIVIVSGGEVVNVVIPLQKKKALKKGFILITKQTGCPICLTKSDCPTVFNLVGKSCSNCATLAYEIEIGNKIIQGSLIVDLRYFILVRV